MDDSAIAARYLKVICEVTRIGSTILSIITSYKKFEYARKSIGLFVSGLEYTTDPQAVSQSGLTCAVDPFTNHAIRILAALVSRKSWFVRVILIWRTILGAM